MGKGEEEKQLDELRNTLYGAMRAILVGYLKMASNYRYGNDAKRIISEICYNNAKYGDHKGTYINFVRNDNRDIDLFDKIDVSLASALLRFDLDDLVPFPCGIDTYKDIISKITNDRNILIGHYIFTSIEDTETKILEAFCHLADFLSFLSVTTKRLKEIKKNTYIDWFWNYPEENDFQELKMEFVIAMHNEVMIPLIKDIKKYIPKVLKSSIIIENRYLYYIKDESYKDLKDSSLDFKGIDLEMVVIAEKKSKKIIKQIKETSENVDQQVSKMEVIAPEKKSKSIIQKIKDKLSKLLSKLWIFVQIIGHLIWILGIVSIFFVLFAYLFHIVF